jgi:processive 1,2-diacylglycerol beta-glucosyltransferase
MKKILIAYATAGIGHKKAAIAIKKAFDEAGPKDTEVKIIDALDYATPFFKKSYLDTYLLAINKLSTIWGTMYYITDNPIVNIFIKPLRKINNRFYAGKLRAFLLEEQPDVMISTHFFLPEAIYDLKDSGKLKSKILTVVTDYRLHSWWVADCIDMYAVASDEARKDLLKWGVPGSKIRVMGIPVEPVFSRRQDKAAIRAKYGLKDDIFTALIMSGGFGVGPIEGIVRAVDGISKPAQAVVICGHNEELVKQMEALKPSLKIDLKVLGFVDNVYDFMEVSDVLISKAGGITVTEAMAKELPVIIIKPIPGQETRNSDFFTSHGAAIRVNDVSEIKGVLDNLTGTVREGDCPLTRMKASIQKIRKPTASVDITKLAIEMAEDI